MRYGPAGCVLYWSPGAVNFDTAFSGFSRDTPCSYSRNHFGSWRRRRGWRGGRLFCDVPYWRVVFANLAGIIIVDFLMTFNRPSATARVVTRIDLLGKRDAFGVATQEQYLARFVHHLTYSARSSTR